MKPKRRRPLAFPSSTRLDSSNSLSRDMEYIQPFTFKCRSIAVAITRINSRAHNHFRLAYAHSDKITQGVCSIHQLRTVQYFSGVPSRLHRSAKLSASQLVFHLVQFFFFLFFFFFFALSFKLSMTTANGFLPTHQSPTKDVEELSSCYNK